MSVFQCWGPVLQIMEEKYIKWPFTALPVQSKSKESQTMIFFFHFTTCGSTSDCVTNAFSFYIRFQLQERMLLQLFWDLSASGDLY